MNLSQLAIVALAAVVASNPVDANPDARQLFTKVAPGSNNCPQGFTYITSADECERAAASFDKNHYLSLSTSVTASNVPKGCYEINSNYYFNKHDTGSANADRALVCKQGDVNVNVTCQCVDNWSSPDNGDSCLEQRGCTNCDNDPNGSWCLISNPGCDTEEGDEQWSYCECKDLSGKCAYLPDAPVCDKQMQRTCPKKCGVCSDIWFLKKENTLCFSGPNEKAMNVGTYEKQNVDVCANAVKSDPDCSDKFFYAPTTGRCHCEKIGVVCPRFYVIIYNEYSLTGAYGTN